MVIRLLSTVLSICLVATAASAQTLTTQVVASGLSQPVGFVQNPAIANVQHILQKEGLIRTLQGGTLLATPFLDLTAKVEAASEQGVLGLAFALDYATSGRLYVVYSKRVPATPGVGSLVVARFKRHATDPLRADASTEFDLVWPGGNGFVTQPFGNHKGGNLAFGADNMLYIGLGDGGSGSDPFHNAQNPATLLGKMLRVDVSVADSDAQGYDVPPDNPFVGRPGVLTEIWSFGWRNPWRWSFDLGPLATGAMIVGDVGQGLFEEIDYEPAGRSGRNYGWRNREGAHDHVTTVAPFSTPLTEPLWEYGRSAGQAVIGGFVYRGIALGPGHAGRYFFADFNGRVWSLGLTVNALTGEATAGTLVDHSAELGVGASQVASFGIDANRELYVVNFSGTVRRIVLVTPLSPAVLVGCSTPDPFAALGGGTCHNGGWLPPGVTPPGAAPSPPAPSPPAPAPAPSTGTCATPDPFAAMGGGTCYSGGWLPPGMAPPSGTPAPTTPAPSTPTPPSAPAPSSGTCTTPNPFLAMGGGTCYNGGWLPPGMAPPSGAPAPPAPTPAPPAPAPTPPSSSGGCATPDPFIGMGGGTCYNGGWLPPGMSPPGGTPSAPTAPAPTPPAPTTPSPTSGAVVLNDALGGQLLFPSSNWWNQDISTAPLDPNSSAYIDFIGRTRSLHPDFGPHPYGIPYIGVGGAQTRLPITFVAYGSESDTGIGGLGGYPIPDEAKVQATFIEGGVAGGGSSGDRHLIVVDRDRALLYELFATRWNATLDRWEAGSGAIFDLSRNDRRTDGWTSADAAGLAILPGLVRYDEVMSGAEIRHALRVTVRSTNGYVWPASHRAGSTVGALPMGARLRLKASKDISGYPPYIQRIFRAMKTYGLIVADNGSDMYITGTMDSRWNNSQLNPAFHGLTANDFEVVLLGWR